MMSLYHKTKVIDKNSIEVSNSVVIIDNLFMGVHISFNDKVFILTNKHTCEYNKTKYNSDYISFDGQLDKIIALDSIHDLCLVTSNRPVGLVISNTHINITDKIFILKDKNPIIGKFLGKESIFFKEETLETIKVSSIYYKISSGTPIINEKEELVGVVIATSKNNPSISYTVPLSYIRTFLELYTR